MRCLVAALLLFATTHVAKAQPAAPAFEVASVKPSPRDADPNSGSWSIPGGGNFTAVHVSLSRLIMLAYDVDDSQLANKPGWADTSLYDVIAKPEEGVRLTRDALRPRLRALLEERFHLVTHIEMRSARGFALVPGKDGPHLTPTKGDHFPGFRTDVSPGHMSGFNWSMPVFAKYLTPAAGFPVVDQTGLTGSFDISFSYATDSSTGSNLQDALPPLAEAIKQSTGLLLKPQKVSVMTVIVDSIDPLTSED